MLTVRLSNKTEKELREFCEQQQKTKSQVVKEALTLYLQQVPTTASPYGLGKDLFGLESSDRTDNSARYKSRVKGKLNEKYAR
ncbi:MAG: hypothetical protein WBA23_22110 [Tunicatimonas sp.]|uniref:hypothetical protein n=1 Tax=Tunicatimonas sp. TaxID=1940096 RepID=UPI003C77CBD6